jgi:hypothetical protein
MCIAVQRTFEKGERWAHEKSHIAPGLRQPATKVTINGTGADGENPHRHIECLVMR